MTELGGGGGVADAAPHIDGVSGVRNSKAVSGARPGSNVHTLPTHINRESIGFIGSTARDYWANPSLLFEA